MESGKNHRSELGQLGERLACELLMGMGHTILERNWRSGHLEIDIISFDAEGIHFAYAGGGSEGWSAASDTRRLFRDNY